MHFFQRDKNYERKLTNEELVANILHNSLIAAL